MTEYGMTARNREGRSDSDTIRLIREEAFDVCAQKNNRLWWAIGLIFTTMFSVASAGAYVAMMDHGMLLENGSKIIANEKTIVDMKTTLIRMDDKLDRILREASRK